MGFFGTSFSYFKIILLYTFTVSVLVSATYLKNPYSFLLENGNKNLHVGTYYSLQTMHENTYACIPDYAHTQLWRFSQGDMCFCIRLKIVYNYDFKLICYDTGIVTFSLCLPVTSHSSGKKSGFHYLSFIKFSACSIWWLIQ